MITVCTVVLDSIKKFYEICIESIATRTKMVSEVLLAKVDDPVGTEKKWNIGNIQFHQFGIKGYERNGPSDEHALGLHECIDRAKNDLLLFCDPDVFFYCAIDEFYYNLMNKYDLNIVGVSHCAALRRTYTFYPYLSSLMVRKKDLPNKIWVDENLSPILNGKFLLPTPIPGVIQHLPNPEGDVDTGLYLSEIGNKLKWNWLSFQTTDVHTYSPLYRRSNIKIKENIGNHKLLYHSTSSTIVENPEHWELFEKAWLKSKRENND
jgi:hypothetical protein